MLCDASDKREGGGITKCHNASDGGLKIN